MIITPVKHGLEEILGKSWTPRTPGLHMSEIYNDLFQRIEPKRYKKGGPPDPLRLEAGLALEEMLEEGLKRRLVGERPGEFTTEEGIIFTPDLLIFNGSTRLGEIKLTWMWSKDVPREPGNAFPPKFDKYLCQIKSYCHKLETNEARLIAFFVNGKGDSVPELLAWDITFTARELHENWAMLMNHARSRRML